MQTTQTELKPVCLTELRNRLSAADYELFRRSVVMRCMITNATWSNWMLNKSNPEEKYKPIIDEVAARFGIVVFNREGAEK